jgi:fructose-bisphosphate aldolase, class I
MKLNDLSGIAGQLVAGGKGILAADETPSTMTKRLEALRIPSTPDSRRAYREMFLTTPGIAKFVSGMILQHETIHQTSSEGTPLAEVLADQGILPGIKVDTGAKPFAGSPEERITEGLDGLRSRLKEYRDRGARFAKWRAVIMVSDTLPTPKCVRANVHALARYAALCQEQEVVPIVEPEVLMTGTHTLERCEKVTGEVLQAVFEELFDQDVALEAMLLKPNMVVPGMDCDRQASVKEVALATLRCLTRHVPAAVPGVVFLSGGQGHIAATAHLNAINRLEGPKPWKISFSYGRALQDEALKAWLGKKENVEAAQRAFYHRSRCNSAAVLGKYKDGMEGERAVA